MANQPVEFSDTARENADLYRSTDLTLWAQVQGALDSVAQQDERARAWQLRLATGVAYVVTITVPGRDDSYWVVWLPPSSVKPVIQVVHLGRAIPGL